MYIIQQIKPSNPSQQSDRLVQFYKSYSILKGTTIPIIGTVYNRKYVKICLIGTRELKLLLRVSVKLLLSI